MKPNIHPKYYPHAKVHCACGNTFEVGSTKENLEIEICYKCHPFFTGRAKRVVDVGQVQKFQKRLKKQKELARKNKK
ncbi:50S ribosomal protein L31 [bacterium]|nr:50S ribosomal protein L31 [bacterium]